MLFAWLTSVVFGGSCSYMYGCSQLFKFAYLPPCKHMLMALAVCCVRACLSALTVIVPRFVQACFEPHADPVCFRSPGVCCFADLLDPGVGER
mmetsp:Transcript_70048/g.176483  ORF Transcript_70048/g.176483 Transcript_70048/m.176483 type:complete len:93 (+) Transcript_70048:360-638(+)